MLNFCSSSMFFSCCIWFCMSWIFARRVVSNVSKIMWFVVFVGSSPSFTTITFFWHFAHHRLLLFSLKSGDEHAGQARFVRVVPWRSRSAICLMCWFSLVFGCGKF